MGEMIDTLRCRHERSASNHHGNLPVVRHRAQLTEEKLKSMSEELTEEEAMIDTTEGGGDEATAKYGRRALMVGAAAGVGAAASLIAGGDPAGATDGDAVLAGDSNTATATTEIATSDGIGLQGVSADSSGLYGVSGTASGITGIGGVVGDSSSQDGVVGKSSGAIGVYGVTTGVSEAGVLGQDLSAGTNGQGLFGESTNGIGVLATGGRAPLQVSPVDPLVRRPQALTHLARCTWT